MPPAAGFVYKHHQRWRGEHRSCGGGDKVAQDDRYAPPPNSSTCARVWDGAPFDYDGRFFRTEGAALPPLLAGQPFPEVFFSGSSARRSRRRGARRRFTTVLARAVRGPARQVRRCSSEHSAKLGRTPKFAVRIDIVARHTEEAGGPR
ncbi:LLM class flavin-dependent oxidoreductase [Rhodococcus hoagii]|nr:LLM class flavin-dependent oxidoreductase [Prescottella equi]